MPLWVYMCLNWFKRANQAALMTHRQTDDWRKQPVHISPRVSRQFLCRSICDIPVGSALKNEINTTISVYHSCFCVVCLNHIGPVTVLCRRKWWFKSPFVQKRQGCSTPVLSVCAMASSARVKYAYFSKLLTLLFSIIHSTRRNAGGLRIVRRSWC